MHQRLPQAGCVVSNLGVGWPGNTGPDTPPVWDWFAPVAATMGNRDYLGAHEYCGLNGIMENWGWWLGRILKCPYKVPMLITEYGPPDGGVYGASHAKQGWRNYPGHGLGGCEGGTLYRGDVPLCRGDRGRWPGARAVPVHL